MITQGPIVYKAEDWLRNVFSVLGNSYGGNFSGLGLILYQPPLALPVVPLTQNEQELPVPARGVLESIQLLQSLCHVDSAFHDGFHLVDAQTLSVTNVSQFFSPPIPDVLPNVSIKCPIGARFMAAWLGSLLPNVCLTAILSQVEGGLLFNRGQVRIIFPTGK
jgi:hypothetical protein